MDKFQTLREKNNPSNNVYPDIKGQNIPDGAVTTPKIADNAITTPKIADNAITSSKIADDSITTDMIEDSAVTTIKIASSAVTMAKIASGAVTETKIGDGNVSSTKFKNEWHNLTYWFNDQNVTNWASLITWAFAVYESHGFGRMIFKDGSGFYPVELYVDYDNGEVQFMRLTSTGYVPHGPYIDSDADFNDFLANYADDVWALGFIN